jgi:hypothetical protein
MIWEFMFNFTMLVYFHSKIAGEKTVEAVKEEISQPAVTSEEVITELRFLEFQLEKEYISAEEYEIKRIEYDNNKS